MQQQIPDVKVLVAGLNVFPNQFTRPISKKGCEVAHTDANDKAFAKDADLVVFVKCQLDQKKQKTIREFYREKNVPILVADQGFSEISHQFDSLLFDVRGKKAGAIPTLSTPAWKIEAEKRFSQFLQQNLPDAPSATPETIPPVEPTEIPTLELEAMNTVDLKPTPARPSMTRYLNDPLEAPAIDKLVREYLAADFSDAEIREALVAEGFQESSVQKEIPLSFIERFRVPLEPIPKYNVAAESRATSVAPPTPGLLQDLLSQTLDSSLSDSDKVRLMRDIARGEVTRLRWMTCEKKGSDSLNFTMHDLLTERRSSTVTLTREFLGLMTDFSEQIETFLNEGQHE